MRPFTEVEKEAMDLCKKLDLVDEEDLNLIANIVHTTDLKETSSMCINRKQCIRLVQLLSSTERR